jgi:hypothetical protein
MFRWHGPPLREPSMAWCTTAAPVLYCAVQRLQFHETVLRPTSGATSSVEFRVARDAWRVELAGSCVEPCCSCTWLLQVTIMCLCIVLRAVQSHTPLLGVLALCLTDTARPRKAASPVTG